MAVRRYPRWFLAAFSLVLGGACLAAFWIGGNPGQGLFSFAVIGGLGVASLVLGRSELVRGLRGDGRDEYWAALDRDASLFAGLFLITLVIAMCCWEWAHGRAARRTRSSAPSAASRTSLLWSACGSGGSYAAWIGESSTADASIWGASIGVSSALPEASPFAPGVWLRATSTERLSRITVTFTWPGYSSWSSISRAISCESSAARSSSTSVGLHDHADLAPGLQRVDLVDAGLRRRELLQ